MKIRLRFLCLSAACQECSNFVVAKEPSFFGEISGTSFSNLILYSSFIREWSNLWTMEEMSDRARYNVNFARVRGDILILHNHKFAWASCQLFIKFQFYFVDKSKRFKYVQYRKIFFPTFYTSLFIRLLPTRSNESFKLLSLFSHKNLYF